MILARPFAFFAGADVDRLHALGRWVRPRVWLCACLLTVSILVYPLARDFVLGIEVTAAERGYQVAMRAGCFDCHGPNGLGGIANPGSEDGEVPAFAGGTPMMWVKNEAELREYVLDGGISRRRDHPIAKYFIRWQRVSMPAYRGFVTDAQLAALSSYVRWVNGGEWRGQPLDLGH